MTVSEVARLEGVSTRQVQRYCTVGFQGHVLPATRVGKSFQIEESVYRQWRVACDFEQVLDLAAICIQVAPGGNPPGSHQVEVIAPPLRRFPPWPQPADPAGQLTNAPHANSSNWPHPESCRIYIDEQRRKQQLQH
jgi:hypothetical protein